MMYLLAQKVDGEWVGLSAVPYTIDLTSNLKHGIRLTIKKCEDLVTDLDGQETLFHRILLELKVKKFKRLLDIHPEIVTKLINDSHYKDDSIELQFVQLHLNKVLEVF